MAIMKKFVGPILVIIGWFIFMYLGLSSTERTREIALMGAGYSALLCAIYVLIPAIKNPNYSMWWKLSDDVTTAERWGFTIANALACAAICSSSFQITKGDLSEISIVHLAAMPIVVAAIALFVRRLIVKHNP